MRRAHYQLTFVTVLYLLCFQCTLSFTTSHRKSFRCRIHKKIELRTFGTAIYGSKSSPEGRSYFRGKTLLGGLFRKGKMKIIEKSDQEEEDDKDLVVSSSIYNSTINITRSNIEELLELQKLERKIGRYKSASSGKETSLNLGAAPILAFLSTPEVLSYPYLAEYLMRILDEIMNNPLVWEQQFNTTISNATKRNLKGSAITSIAYLLQQYDYKDLNWWLDESHVIVTQKAETAFRIVENLIKNNEPEKLVHFIEKNHPTITPLVPYIIARLDLLERHVDHILENVFRNPRILHLVEPYFVDILIRFDEIEPYLTW